MYGEEDKNLMLKSLEARLAIMNIKTVTESEREVRLLTDPVNSIDLEPISIKLLCKITIPATVERLNMDMLGYLYGRRVYDQLKSYKINLCSFRP